MSYATLAHVQAQNSGRPTFTSSTKPSASQVILFLHEAAGMMDAALVRNGYGVPVFALGSIPVDVPTVSQMYLQTANAVGAAYMVEASAQTSDRRERFEQMWQSMLKALETKEVPGLGKDAAQSMPRYAPHGASPYFSRDMEL